MARNSWGYEGSYTPPPLPPVAAPPRGGARGGATHERRFFRDIACTDSVPGAAGLPSTPSIPPNLRCFLPRGLAFVIPKIKICTHCKQS